MSPWSKQAVRLDCDPTEPPLWAVLILSFDFSPVCFILQCCSVPCAVTWLYPPDPFSALPISPSPCRVAWRDTKARGRRTLSGSCTRTMPVEGRWESCPPGTKASRTPRSRAEWVMGTWGWRETPGTRFDWWSRGFGPTTRGRMSVTRPAQTANIRGITAPPSKSKVRQTAFRAYVHF